MKFRISAAALLSLALVVPAWAQLAPAAAPAAASTQQQQPITVVLSQKKVVKDERGRETLVEADTVKPNDVLEYRAVYKNVSTKPVKSVAANLPLPEGLEYMPGSAQPKKGVQFAPASGTYGAEPLTRKLPNGRTENLPYNEYRQARWVFDELAPGAEATGASAGSTVLPDGSATSVSGTSYTYSRASQQIAFTAASAGQASLSFGLVPVSTLSPASSSRAAGAGVSAVHPHQFTAGTGGSLQIALGAGTATPSTLTGWSEIAYLDTGCTGTVQAGATRLYPSGTPMTVTQGQTVCFVVQERVPVLAANGNSYAVPVTATLALTNAQPSLTATYTATDTTTASSTAVTLTKEVRNVTQAGTFGTANQAKSGEVLEYRITYANTTTSPVTTLVVNDAVPTYTSFVSAQAETTPAALGTCAKTTPANAAPAATVECATTQAAGGTGPISWSFSGALQAGATGAVVYQVMVD